MTNRVFKDVRIHGDKTYYSLAEAARRTGFCIDTLRRHIRNGTLSAITIGAYYYIERGILYDRYEPKGLEPKALKVAKAEDYDLEGV